jgi:Flp pilus assembly protein protease CpaA
MGGLSITHWIILLLSILFVVVAPIIHVAVSDRSVGWQKAFWVLALLFVPVIPYIFWLVFTKNNINNTV